MAQAQVNRKRRMLYSKESLQEAVSAVKTGKMSGYRAAIQFGVPHSTISDRLHERCADKSPGPERMLTVSQEISLISYITYMARNGFPARRNDLRFMIQELLERDGRLEESRFNPTGPSDKWFRGFLRRHEELQEKVSQTRKRAIKSMTNECAVDAFYTSYKQVVDTLGLADKPAQIFNCGATGFTASERAREKALGLYTEEFLQEEVITVKGTIAHVTISASGRVLPTMIIYLKSLPHRTLEEEVPSDWLFTTSKSGYMDTELFTYWFRDVFEPYCGPQRPVLLLLDTHGMHISIDVLDIAREKQIEIFALPPHTTHILQPLEVQFFGPMKKQFYQLGSSVCGKRRTIKRVSMPNILNMSINQMAPAFVQAAFAKTGLYPFNAEAVDMIKVKPSVKVARSKDEELAKSKGEEVDDDGSIVCPTCGRIAYTRSIFFETKVG